MQGTGTQADPYQITNCDELIEYAKQNDVYLKLMNDIDFNNYTGWMLSTIDVKCFEIDGDGHSLNNIYIKNVSLFNITDEGGPFTERTSTFKNMIMEIIQIGNSPIFTGYEQASNQHKYIQILDCDIRIKSYPSNSNNILYYTNNLGVGINIRRSILNIDVYGCGYNVTLINSPMSTRCNHSIEYSEIQVNVYNGDNTNITLIGRILVDNVAIFVNMDKIDTNKTYNLLDGTHITNSYIISKQDNLEKINWTINSSINVLTTCFYNKDYMQLNTSVTNLYDLTTAECKSVSKLTELGFIVT
jgi:hypothetical protein